MLSKYTSVDSVFAAGGPSAVDGTAVAGGNVAVAAYGGLAVELGV